jgi:hypothetical protein
VWERKLQVLAYIHEGIKIEGIRDKLILNAVAFKSSSEVLEDLRRKLPEWRLEPVPSVEIELTYRRLTCTAENHNYRLLINVKNTSEEVISDYHVDLEFPPELITTFVDSREVSNRRTDTHALLRVSTERNEVNTLYPGDPSTVMTLDYFVDRDIHTHHREVLNRVVSATVYVKDSPPKSVRKSISELQEF